MTQHNRHTANGHAVNGHAADEPANSPATDNLIAALTAKKVDYEIVSHAMDAPGVDVNALGWMDFGPGHGKAKLPILALAALAVPRGSNRKILVGLLEAGADPKVTVDTLVAFLKLVSPGTLPGIKRELTELEMAVVHAVRAVGAAKHFRVMPVPPARMAPPAAEPLPARILG